MIILTYSYSYFRLSLQVTTCNQSIYYNSQLRRTQKSVLVLYHYLSNPEEVLPSFRHTPLLPNIPLSFLLSRRPYFSLPSHTKQVKIFIIFRSYCFYEESQQSNQTPALSFLIPRNSFFFHISYFPYPSLKGEVECKIL